MVIVVTSKTFYVYIFWNLRSFDGAISEHSRVHTKLVNEIFPLFYFIFGCVSSTTYDFRSFIKDFQNVGARY